MFSQNRILALQIRLAHQKTLIRVLVLCFLGLYIAGYINLLESHENYMSFVNPTKMSGSAKGLLVFVLIIMLLPSIFSWQPDTRSFWMVLWSILLSPFVIYTFGEPNILSVFVFFCLVFLPLFLCYYLQSWFLFKKYNYGSSSFNNYSFLFNNYGPSLIYCILLPSFCCSLISLKDVYGQLYYISTILVALCLTFILLKLPNLHVDMLNFANFLEIRAEMHGATGLGLETGQKKIDEIIRITGAPKTYWERIMLTPKALHILKKFHDYSITKIEADASYDLEIEPIRFAGNSIQEAPDAITSELRVWLRQLKTNPPTLQDWKDSGFDFSTPALRKAAAASHPGAPIAVPSLTDENA